MNPSSSTVRLLFDVEYHPSSLDCPFIHPRPRQELPGDFPVPDTLENTKGTLTDWRGIPASKVI